ncbi:MAG TPA: hypothetical protein ENH84_01855, partial [Phycisphaerae bacterium]|nr:hypothetical protein [Phycisphaerae bacterium]
MRNKQILFNRTAKTNRSSRSNRGSVILMVIGLLTIIAMLGTSFLLISRLDRKQSEAIAAKAAADPIAEGILAQLVATLKDDLYIDSDGPYGDVGVDSATTDEQLRRFVDYASSSDATLPIEADDWLWYDDGTTTHLSNVIGLPPNPPYGPDDYADTDGDTTIPNDRDAYLVPTGITNSKGQEYFAAVRVVDLSGLINVNIASRSREEPPNPADFPLYDAPVLVDLRGFIGSALYDDTAGKLNDERSG